MTIKMIETVSAWNEEIAAIRKAVKPNGYDGLAFHDLDGDQVTELNDWYAANIRVVIVRTTPEIASTMLGLKECNPAEVVPFGKFGEKWYCAENNPHNRLRNAMLSDSYLADMQAGLWALSDPLVFDWEGFIVSAQHRAGAVVSLPDGSVLFIAHIGLPTPFADVIDRQRRRTTKDVTFRGNEVSETLLQDGLEEKLEASDIPKIKAAISGHYTTSRNYLLFRLSGKNIHSSNSGLSERDVLSFGKRFPTIEIEGERVSELAVLCRDVYRASFGDDGKARDSFSRFPLPMLVTALVLKSNSTHTDSSELSVDFDLVRNFLSALKESTDSTGPMAVAIKSIAEAKKKVGKATLARNSVFHCVVSMVEQFATKGEVTDNPFPSKKIEGKDQYLCFGGVDIGKVEKAKKDE